MLSGCNQSAQKTASAEKEASTHTKDEEKLQILIRQFYRWHETKSSGIDFSPIQREKLDTTYVCLDLQQHEERLEELKQTNFFSAQFLNNYNKLALTIDERLRNKKLQWVIAEMPPFGNGANPWCNCQDNPDEYWQKITLNNMKFDKDTASFSWTWGDDFEYKVKAIKENGNWKISYLQGFDFDEFFK